MDEEEGLVGRSGGFFRRRRRCFSRWRVVEYLVEILGRRRRRRMRRRRSRRMDRRLILRRWRIVRSGGGGSQGIGKKAKGERDAERRSNQLISP